MATGFRVVCGKSLKTFCCFGKKCQRLGRGSEAAESGSFLAPPSKLLSTFLLFLGSVSAHCIESWPICEAPKDAQPLRSKTLRYAARSSRPPHGASPLKALRQVATVVLPRRLSRSSDSKREGQGSPLEHDLGISESIASGFSSFSLCSGSCRIVGGHLSPHKNENPALFWKNDTEAPLNSPKRHRDPQRGIQRIKTRVRLSFRVALGWFELSSRRIGARPSREDLEAGPKEHKRNGNNYSKLGVYWDNGK